MKPTVINGNSSFLRSVPEQQQENKTLEEEEVFALLIGLSHK